MEYDDVVQSVFDAYAQELYRVGLDLVREARPRFPDKDARLTFFEACLLSMDGHPNESLAELEAGLDRGLFWHERALADHDLDAARLLLEWDEFVERSHARTEEWADSRPPAQMRSIDAPTGTLIALHGAGAEPGEFFAGWCAATPSSWDLVVPVGGVPVSNVGWTWSYALEPDGLVAQLAKLDMARPLVLAAFSQGGALAARNAWAGAIDVDGLVLIAASLRRQIWDELTESAPRRLIPTYVVGGSEDRLFDNTVDSIGQLRNEGIPVHIDIREGMGHAVPADLSETIRNALDWILAQSA